MSCSLSCSPPAAPSAHPLPAVSGRPRTNAHRIFEKNATLIWATMARRFPSLLADANTSEEAWSAGAVGLLRAAERFDAKRGLAFSTYAVACIEGELRRFLSRRNTAIHQPVWLAELTGRVGRSEQEFQTRTGRRPTHAETAQALGVSVEDVTRVHASRDVFSLTSLDSLAGARGEDGRPLQEVIPDTRQEAPGTRMLADAGKEALLASLTPQQRRVIEGLYLEDRTATELAPALGISSSRVRQLHTAALSRMRESLAEPPVRKMAA